MSHLSFRNHIPYSALIAFVFVLAAGAENREYQKWLDEDVHWIITPQERAEFAKLSGDEQRDHFVEQFWGGRNPTPSAPRNAFKQEHYRRLAFANEHFAADIPGWETDRGRIYIIYGPPDAIDSHPPRSGKYPYEIWQYRHAEQDHKGVSFKFLDKCVCGKYQLENDSTSQ